MSEQAARPLFNPIGGLLPPEPLACYEVVLDAIHFHVLAYSEAQALTVVADDSNPHNCIPTAKVLPSSHKFDSYPNEMGPVLDMPVTVAQLVAGQFHPHIIGVLEQ